MTIQRNTPYTQQELKRLSTIELRSVARGVFDKPRLWIVSAAKPVLIEAILTGKRPDFAPPATPKKLPSELEAAVHSIVEKILRERGL